MVINMLWVYKPAQKYQMEIQEKYAFIWSIEFEEKIWFIFSFTYIFCFLNR
jgi:hypothetical protein